MWTLGDLLDATQGQLIRGEGRRVAASGISIDSRRLKSGEAFVAIRGPRFDGHHFAHEVASRGAACLIVSSPPEATNGTSSIPTILVDDTTKALGNLARFHRRRFDMPVIAITGSCGKTTTKELVAHLLGDPGTILKNVGTQNNHIGVPLTLLRLSTQHRTAVIELGSNHPGEIAYLASIAMPTVAVITNVGPVHLEFFGSLMEVLKEKLSLLDLIPPDGSVILPGDQLDVCLDAQQHLHPRARVVYFGSTERCDLQVMDIRRTDAGRPARPARPRGPGPSPERDGVRPLRGHPDGGRSAGRTSTPGMAIRLRDRAAQFMVPIPGYHNVENALAALTCTWALGQPLEDSRRRLSTFEGPPMRSELVRCNGLTILNDCYNANPLSFARALETLRDLPVDRKIAVVGDMLELGDYAPAAHQAIGRMAGQLGVDEVLAVGEFSEFVARGVREAQSAIVTTFQTVSELLQSLPTRLQHGDGLLVKGSRRMNLEQVTEYLLQNYRSS